MALHQYIGARYVPKIIGDWTPNTLYEPLTVVIYNFNSYTSKQDVPANIGAPDLNPEYWACTGAYNAQVETYHQEVVRCLELIEKVPDTYSTGKEYGIVGDGIADDSAAFQNAVDNSKILDLEGMTLKISEQINMPSDILIKNGEFVFTSADPMFYAENKSNIIFYNLKITFAYREGTDDNNSIQWFPLHFKTCSNIRWLHCTFVCRDCRSVGFTGCSNVYIIDCHFTNCEGTGLTFNYCSHYRVLFSEFDAPNQYDISWHTTDNYGKGDNVVSAVWAFNYFHDFHGCATQFTSTPGTYDIKDAIFCNNTVIRFGDVGIKIDGVTSPVVIENNIFDTSNYFNDARSAYGVSLGGQSGVADKVIIKNNKFYNIASYIFKNSETETVVNELIFEDNECINFGRVTEIQCPVVNLIIKNNIFDNGYLFISQPTTVVAGQHYKTLIANNICNNISALFIRGVSKSVIVNDNMFDITEAPATGTAFIRFKCAFARIENNSIVGTYTSSATYYIGDPIDTVTIATINGNFIYNRLCSIETPANVTNLYTYAQKA